MSLSVRNSEGLWVNTQGFREEALHFSKYGYYCPDPWGSQPWVEYWQEQLRRCKEGHSSGGAYVTGDHYFYLNFCQIQLTDVTKQIKGKATDKKKTFPFFWDGDYDYYHNMNIARYGTTPEKLKELHLINEPKQIDGGRHMIVGKARRKGFSYKNAAIVVNRYNSIRGSVSIIGAFDKKYLYPRGTMAMASDYMDFLNAHTGWAKKREYVDRSDAKEASFRGEVNGVLSKRGYVSSVLAISFKDNPSAARGKDGTLILFEEAGSFPNLETSYLVTKPSLEDGKYVTGQMVVFGTSGGDDMYDFAKMFYSPEAYGAISYENVWDEHAVDAQCSFFFPDYQNKPGFIDEHGNSDRQAAKEYEEKKREEIRSTASSPSTITTHTQEFCFSPEEAFLQSTGNVFPVQEARAQLARVMSNKLHLKLGQPVHLTREDGKVKAVPDLNNELNPIWEWKPKPKKNGDLDLSGAVVIFEPPRPGAMPGTYLIGYDPIQQDQGTSLASIIVYKWSDLSYTSGTIVADYYGRLENPDGTHRIAEYLAEYYSAEIMYENMVPDVKTYFRNKNKLHLLAEQPDNVIRASIKESSVKRVYGIHMTDNLIEAGEKYSKKWMIEERSIDETDKIILNIHTVNIPGFLEEVIAYKKRNGKRVGNYDRLSAFFMIQFQMQEKTLERQSKSSDFNQKVAEELEQLRNIRQPRR